MSDPVIVLSYVCLAGSILLVLAFLSALLVPQIVSTFRLRKKSRHHYRTARGTLHKRQLHAALSNLQREISVLRNGIENTKKQLAALEQERSSELRVALCRHLVDNHLTEVKGIGPELSGRIVRVCFRNDLRDLQYARYVSGVGPTRQQAINQWIWRYERELPRLLAEDFPGKAGIEDRYKDHEQKLKHVFDLAHSRLEETTALFRTGHTAFKKLNSVQLSHFHRALSGKSSDSPVPEWYFEGVHPAWESAPEWFKTLVENYGG